MTTTYGAVTSRRQALKALLAPGLAASALGMGSVLHAAGQARAPFMAQIVDMSPQQQDISRDFLLGTRSALQDINARGGIRGRPIGHQALEIDGSEASIVAALAQVKDNPACVCLLGTTGDALTGQLISRLQRDSLPLAHVAPWLQNSSVEVDERTFPIFATRQDQIAHALKSLSVMGVAELGAVYASAQDFQQSRDDVERIAGTLKISPQTFRGDDLRSLGQRLTAKAPAILLFIGGTPELVQFTQGLDRQARQRYVIALADVNMQTLLQMGAGKTTPVIGTQAVPVVGSGLPVVRQYRETFGRLFDEPPSPMSLGGFIAARYAYEVLSDMDGPFTRAHVLAAFQRRVSTDVGGYRVSYNGRRRGSAYVTQSMMTTDGRLIG